jgi:hypothetical protein
MKSVALLPCPWVCSVSVTGLPFAIVVARRSLAGAQVLRRAALATVAGAPEPWRRTGEVTDPRLHANRRRGQRCDLGRIDSRSRAAAAALAASAAA